MTDQQKMCNAGTQWYLALLSHMRMPKTMPEVVAGLAVAAVTFISMALALLHLVDTQPTTRRITRSEAMNEEALGYPRDPESFSHSRRFLAGSC